MIKANDVEKIVQDGEVIEDYPEDERGHSCLLLGFDAQTRPIHVVCSPKEDYLAIITVYLPHPSKWDQFKQAIAMKCMYCHAAMMRHPAPFQITRQHYHVTLERVPAWVCSQCGEVYFETPEVEAIQNLIESLEVQSQVWGKVA